MAIDSRDKRSSAIGWGLPFRPLPQPDGDVDEGDRMHLAFSYASAADGSTPAPTTVSIPAHRVWRIPPGAAVRSC